MSGPHGLTCRTCSHFDAGDFYLDGGAYTGICRRCTAYSSAVREGHWCPEHTEHRPPPSTGALIEDRLRAALLPHAGVMPMDRFEALVKAAVEAVEGQPKP